MICPILKHINYDLKCIEDKCLWYNKTKNVCDKFEEVCEGEKCKIRCNQKICPSLLYEMYKSKP